MDESMEQATAEYGTGRRCAQEGCHTVLSRYNPSEYCTTCYNPRRVDRTLLRVVNKMVPEGSRTSVEGLRSTRM